MTVVVFVWHQLVVHPIPIAVSRVVIGKNTIQVEGNMFPSRTTYFQVERNEMFPIRTY